MEDFIFLFKLFFLQIYSGSKEMVLLFEDYIIIKNEMKRRKKISNWRI